MVEQSQTTSQVKPILEVRETSLQPVSNTTGVLKYLEDSFKYLEAIGIRIRDKKESRLVEVLQEVADIDQAKVLNIAQVVQYAQAYNELIRDNVKEMRFSDRYGRITELSDSVIEDANTAVEQLKDGKIDRMEKLHNLGVRITRGTPGSRFDKVKEICEQVNGDVKKQVECEKAMLNAYVQFRSALKEGEALSKEVLKTQEANLQKAKDAYVVANETVEKHTADDSERSRLQGERDRLDFAFKNESRRYQLVKDVSEAFTTAYAAGEVLMAKLAQSHESKDQIYRRGVITLELHDSLFTAMSAAYSSILGGLEAAEVQNARQKSIEKGLEHLSQWGGDVNKKVIEAGYGVMIHAEPIKNAVDAVIKERLESLQLIDKCRQDSTRNAAEVSQIVEEGKQRYQKAVETYYAGAK